MNSPLASIEKQTFLRAPRARVWRALTNAQEFANWFGVEIEGSFAPGARVEMTSTIPGYEGQRFFVIVERMDAEHTFSWRWHPGAQDPNVDYEKEPMTVVTFTLEESEGGTTLTVVETGFDQIALERRARVYEDNVNGWEQQLIAIGKHVSGD
jgi:uncharacterized protein YndB with AHSA1/START domain